MLFDYSYQPSLVVNGIHFSFYILSNNLQVTHEDYSISVVFNSLYFQLVEHAGAGSALHAPTGWR